MASGGGKGQFQYNANANASVMNNNASNRVTIQQKPSQLEHSTSHHHPIENMQGCEIAVASNENPYTETILNFPECPEVPTTVGDGVEKPPAKNKTDMCLINELVRSNKVSCGKCV